MKILLYFIGFLEGIAITNIALALAKIKLEWKKVAMIAIVISTSAHIIKALPVTFGVHTTIYIGLLILLINVLTKVDLTVAVVSGLISVLFVIIVETAVTFLTLTVLQISMDSFVQSDSIRFIAGLFHILILFLISGLIRKYWRGSKGL